jgi:glucosylceramidase
MPVSLQKNPADMRLIYTSFSVCFICFTAFAGYLYGFEPDSFKGKPRTVVYTTAENTSLRLSSSDTVVWENFRQPLETQPSVFVDSTRLFQSFLGIGAAITDASAVTFAAMPANRKQEIIDLFFTTGKGIGYTLVRTTIHSCDFSPESYTYVNENDTSLASFSVGHDLPFRIPMLKRALEATHGNLTLYASPWSPPAWMKDNGSMLLGGKLKPGYAATWARYISLFIRAYEKEGIPIWGLTVQNEPMARQKWESCLFTAEEERDFIRDHLGPELAASGLDNKKLIAWDHNRDLIWHRAEVLMKDPEAAKYIWGLGFHWYESWTGGGNLYDNVRRVSEAWPSLPLLFTEGCAERYDAVKTGDWKYGEMYGRAMINDFNNGAVGWTDWNILLDENGGPNHAGNFCFAPLHANTKTGELVLMNSYYYIGHFSSFIRPGAHRITCASSRGQLLTTGFRNPDGSLVVIVMNQSDLRIDYHLCIGNQASLLVSLPHSIQTVVVN